MDQKKITIYNLSKLPVADFEDFKELQGDFKIQTEVQFGKLKKAILTRGFKYSFKAWKDPKGGLWILDAHQRKKVLKSLRDSGYNVGSVPYELIFAKDKKDAVEELLYINSQYGNFNKNTDLFEEMGINLDEHYFEIPGFDFEEMFKEEKQNRSIPEMELQPYEHHDYIVLMFTDLHDFLNAMNLFGIKKVNFSQIKKQKIGIGRVINGGEAIKKLLKEKTIIGKGKG